MKKAAIITTVLVVCLFSLLLRGPDDAQINLKTGDLRYRILCVPYSYQGITPPYSDWLRGISSGDDRWITVATFPLPTSNNSQVMCQDFYESAATWVTIDPKLAKTVLQDVEHYIVSTEARHSLPDSFPLLIQAQRNIDQKPQIKDGWQSDALVQAYLEKHHLSE